MRTFRKYQFGSKGAATTKINQLSVDEEGNEIEHNHAIVRLGYIPIVKGTYDEEGNELTPPVLSDDYHVDVLWNGEPDEDWEDNFELQYNYFELKNRTLQLSLSYRISQLNRSKRQLKL